VDVRLAALLRAPHMPPDFRKEDYPLHRAGCELWDGTRVSSTWA
jgi:hypothetical protein